MRLYSLLLKCAGLMTCLYSSSSTAWTINNTFDNQNVGDTCGYSAHKGGSPWWNAENSFVTNAQKYSGNRGCSFTIQQGSTGGGWGGGTTLPTKLRRGDEIWIRVRTYMPAGFNYDASAAGNKLKFLRLRTADASGGNTGYVDWYLSPKGSSDPFQIIYEGGQKAVFGSGGCTTDCWTKFGAGDAIQLGKWETFEYYIRLDTVPVSKGGKARVRAWKNGKLLSDMTDKITLARTDGYAPAFLFLNYWNGGSPKTQTMYVDDVTLTTDRPSSTDSTGFPYIGMGNGPSTASGSGPTPQQSAKPNPPVLSN